MDVTVGTNRTIHGSTLPRKNVKRRYTYGADDEKRAIWAFATDKIRKRNAEKIHEFFGWYQRGKSWPNFVHFLSAYDRTKTLLTTL
jgi:hypothetical protein